MKLPRFITLVRSKNFRTREQAEDWASEQKESYDRQGYSVKKEIDYVENLSRWSAKIFIKTTGDRSIEKRNT